MKKSDGIVGLQQDPDLLRNWAIVCVEVIRVISESEQDCPLKDRKTYDVEGPTAETNFVKEVQQTVCNI